LSKTVIFTLGGMTFEYDEDKNQANIAKHKLSLRTAARVFFDNDCIERLDTDHSFGEERYKLIGDLSAGEIPDEDAYSEVTVIGSVRQFAKGEDDIIYVVYTERIRKLENGVPVETIRLISARTATSFERGLYYGQFI